MVGLYHKRRAQRSHSKVLGFLTKALMTLGLMVVIAFVLIVLFFNGNQIKKPLSTYLSAQTGFEVTIGDAEFSPLYPDVIKLSDVSFGNSKIGEFYLEYDLRSALSSERLEINDLYLNGLTITPEDLAQLMASRLGYESIYAHLVRFHHTPVKTQFLQAQDATIRLNQVGFSPSEGLTYRSGALAASAAALFDNEVKDLSLQFEHQSDGLSINNFTAAMLGGMVSGHGRYLPYADNVASTGFSSASGFTQQGGADLIFDELNLSQVILHQSLRPSADINLSAKQVNLSQVIYTNDQQTLAAKQTDPKTEPKAEQSAEPQAESAPTTAQAPVPDASGYHSMVMQGISGKLYNLELSSEHFSARFDGAIDALSFPNLQTSFEHNKGSAELRDEQLSFDFSGSLYEGNYALQGALDRARHELTLQQLKLDKSKLALNPPRLDFLQHKNAYTIKLEQAQFEGLEFLSFLNQLPLSIQTISGSVHDLIWRASAPEANTPATILGPLAADQEGELKLNLHNLLYSNLLFSDIELAANLTPKQLQLSLPQVRLQESSLSAQGTLSLSNSGLSTLALEAQDFESADLNSNLIGHMLTGKVNLNAQLTTSFTGWDEPLNNSAKAEAQSAADTSNEAERLGLSGALLKNLSGRVHLDSSGLLISDFGLDLINGGKRQDYTLTGTELLAALQGSVAGINTLEADTTFKAGKLSTQGRVGLATANSSFSVNIDLLEHDFSGNAFMVSLARDSTTTVSFDGTTQEPRFAIRALRRGAPRPGLYLPQYDAMAQAKEQTDAKGVLNGTVVIDDATSAVAQSAAATEAPEQLSDQALTPTAPATETESEAPEGEQDGTLETETATESETPAPEGEQAVTSETEAANESESPASEGEPTAALESDTATEPEAPASASEQDGSLETNAATEPETPVPESEPAATSETATEPEAPAPESEPAATSETATESESPAPEGEQYATTETDTATESEAPVPESEQDVSLETNAATEPEAPESEPDATSESDTATEPEASESEPDATSETATESESPDPEGEQTAISENNVTAEPEAPASEGEQDGSLETNAAIESEVPAPEGEPNSYLEPEATTESESPTPEGEQTATSENNAAAESEAPAPEGEPNSYLEPEVATESEPENEQAAAAARAAAQAERETAAQAEREAAAQAQADATERALLKDVFIDSFIQHEFGSAAEEAAAQRAAQGAAAPRAGAAKAPPEPEKPYDPEEEMIF